MPDRTDDFYVGYRPRASPEVRDWLRKVIVALFALAVVVPFLLASAQSEFSDAVFEYGNVRSFEGRLAAAPYPVLHVDESGDSRPHYLVEFGKHEARAALDRLDGATVRIDGQLIHRDAQRMIELTDDPPEALAPRTEAPTTPRSFGRHQLVGEILDGKCYLGVMKPGRGKAHRDCAVRCLSGGVPPLLVVTDRDGEQLHLTITDLRGGPVGRWILDFVAEPVAIDGEVVASDGLLYLRASPEALQRLGGSD